MGSGGRYSDEFKQETFNQVVIHGYSIADVDRCLMAQKTGTYCVSVF